MPSLRWGHSTCCDPHALYHDTLHHDITRGPSQSRCSHPLTELGSGQEYLVSCRGLEKIIWAVEAKFCTPKNFAPGQ